MSANNVFIGKEHNGKWYGWDEMAEENMDDMSRRVAVAESKSKFMDMKPDIEWIEDFIYRAYNQELLEYKWMYEELQK